MSVLPGLQQNQTKAFCGVPKFIFWKLDLCKAKIHLTNTMGKLIKLQNCIVVAKNCKGAVNDFFKLHA